MMSTIRIAHISDLHLSPTHGRVNIRNTKRLLEHINRLKVDHVVVTGDIAANAEAGDFRLARSLFQAHGLLDPQKLSLVVGNHDIYGGVHTPEAILDFPRRCRETDVNKKTRQFLEHFPEIFRNTIQISEKSPFPYLKPLGDVVLIGLNSVARYSRLKNPFGSNGRVDEQEQLRLDQALASGRFGRVRTIVLIHHHFNKMNHRTDGTMQSFWKAFEQQTMKLRGKRELMGLFAKHHVDAVLHGHYHQNMDYTRKGLRFVNAGGSILSFQPAVLHLNLLELGADEIRLARYEFPAMDGTAPRQGREQYAVLSASHAAA